MVLSLTFSRKCFFLPNIDFTELCSIFGTMVPNWPIIQKTTTGSFSGLIQARISSQAESLQDSHNAINWTSGFVKSETLSRQVSELSTRDWSPFFRSILTHREGAPKFGPKTQDDEGKCETQGGEWLFDSRPRQIYSRGLVEHCYTARNCHLL